MSSKNFVLPHDKRIAVINIDDYVSFRFKDAQEFYWIDKDDWINSDRNSDSAIYKHLKKKSWFTAEMERFLDETLLKNVPQ